MSEQAKRAAEEIYYSLPLYRDHSDKKMIQEIIDKEFAPIIQQRDELIEVASRFCKWHELNATWDKTGQDYYFAKKILSNATKEQK